MSAIEKLIEEPGGPREWLIKKGGYFYRPNKSGYTTVKSEAGRYTELDARREAEIEPWHMSAIHQNDVPDPPQDVNVAEIASLKATLAASQEEIVRLKAALQEIINIVPTQQRRPHLPIIAEILDVATAALASRSISLEGDGN